MPDESPVDAIRRLSAEMDHLATGAPAGGRPSPASGAPAAVVLPRFTYASATKSATYGLLAALPLLVVYEVAILVVGTSPAGTVRVGADVWLKTILAALGATGWAALGGAVALIGALVLWLERKRRPPLVARWFGFLVVESLGYAVLLALLVGSVVGMLFGVWAVPTGLVLAQGVATLGLPVQLALSIGAGLYEELVFRVLLVGGLALAIRPLVKGRVPAYALAAVVGALAFSAVHYTGALGDPFTASSFTFRFLFGLALNGIFLVRGFAAAAWAHALYDVLVVTNSFG